MPILRFAAATALLAALAACSEDTDGSGSPTTEQSRPPSSTSATVPVTPTNQTSTVPPPTRPVRTKTVTGQFTGSTYVIKVYADRTDGPICADHAYGGPVVDFLNAHPCEVLRRILATTTVDGRDVGFNQSRVSFAGDAPGVFQVANDFTNLVTQEGTGNIDDLFREGYRLPSGPASVPSPDAFKALQQDAVVTIDDIWYLDGPTPENDPRLVQFAEDIYLVFD